MAHERVGHGRAIGGIAIAIVILLSSACLVGLLRVRIALVSARASCAAIPVGSARLDAERDLAAREGASDLGARLSGDGPSAPEVEVFVGRRGELTSWECDLALDASSTRVTRTSFRWWIVPDFHGGWDDDAREWIEAKLL